MTTEKYLFETEEELIKSFTDDLIDIGRVNEWIDEYAISIDEFLSTKFEVRIKCFCDKEINNFYKEIGGWDTFEKDIEELSISNKNAIFLGVKREIQTMLSNTTTLLRLKRMKLSPEFYINSSEMITKKVLEMTNDSRWDE